MKKNSLPLKMPAARMVHTCTDKMIMDTIKIKTNTERLHELCLERLEFFRQQLEKRGYFAKWSVEREVFFEDEKGRALQMREQTPIIIYYLKSKLQYFYRFGNDYKDIDNPDWWNGRHRQKNYPIKNKKMAYYAGLNIARNLGFELPLVTSLARQYEVELCTRIINDEATLPGFLKETAQIDDILDAAPVSLGLYVRTNAQSKSYPHTWGVVATPSMHMNVSVWRKDEMGVYENTFAPHPRNKPPDIAEQCMRAMQILQKQGLPFFLDPQSPEVGKRFSARGFNNPKQFACAQEKNPDASVCYRPENLYRHQASDEYAHIESRLASAKSDPYMVMVMTYGALYTALCKPPYERAEHACEASFMSNRIRDYDVSRTVQSRLLKEVMGEPLFSEALAYYGIDKNVPAAGNLAKYGKTAGQPVSR